MNQTSEQDLALAKELKVVYAELTKEISKVIVGQHDVVQQVLISIFCNTNYLLDPLWKKTKQSILNSTREIHGRTE